MYAVQCVEFRCRRHGNASSALHPGLREGGQVGHRDGGLIGLEVKGAGGEVVMGEMKVEMARVR